MKKKASPRIVKPQAKLKQHEQTAAWHAAFVSSSMDAIIGSSCDGVVTSFNPAAERLFGYRADEIVGRQVSLIIPPERQEEEYSTLNRVASGESVAHYEGIRLHKSGNPVAVSVSVSAVRDAGGAIIGAATIARDITERKQADEALRESEARARTLLEGVAQAFWETDAEGNVVTDSPSWRAYTGQSVDEMMGCGWLNAIYSDDRSLTEQCWRDAVEARCRLDEEYRLRAPDGSYRWTNVRATPVMNEDGSIQKWVGMNIDIDARKQAEEALHQSAATLLNAQRCAGAGVWDVDLLNNSVVWSDPYYDLYGLPTNVEPSLSNWMDSIHPNDRKGVIDEYERALAARKGQHLEFRILRDGEVRWLQSEGRVICDSANRPVRITGIVWDITKRKRTEEALRESEARFRQLADAMPQLVWAASSEGVVDYYNARAAEYGVGVSSSPATYEWEQAIHPEDLASTWEAWREAVARGQTYQKEQRLLMADGRYRWHLSRGQPVRNEEGIVVKWFGTATDIDDFKRAEEALRLSEERERQQRQELETTLAVMPAAVFIAEDKTCARITANRAGYKLLRIPEGKNVSKAASEDEKPKNFEMYSGTGEALAADQRPMNRAATTGRSIEGFEYEIRFSDGDHKHLLANAGPLFDSAGEVRGAIGALMDITERRHQEERIKLLLREINHRSKNMLAVVQSVARQTAAASPEDFLERFSERIQAMATSQDLLVKAEWKGVELEDLIRGQLAHFQDLIASRIELKGPSLLVSTSAAQILGMAIHELSTNAGKYGALSNAEGRVAISWDLERDRAGGETFTMSWREEGGPTASPPSRNGFGSTVIGPLAESSLNAKVDLDFLKTGLSWRLRCAAGGVVEGTRPAPADEARSEVGCSRSSRPKVLVVEDEALIAMEIAQELRKADFEVLGPARAVAQALSLIEVNGCDAAVLDINLSHETSEPVARKLLANGTRFVTLSGYARAQHPAIFDEVPALTKPLQPTLLVAAIKKCLSGKKNGQSQTTG